MKRKRFTEEQIIAILREVEAGSSARVRGYCPPGWRTAGHQPCLTFYKSECRHDALRGNPPASRVRRAV